GCIGECVKQRPNSFTARSTIARQSNGRRMYAAFDAATAPASPLVSAAFDSCSASSSALLSWSPPDDHGSAVTAYNIYRRAGASQFLLLATVGSNVNSFQDNTINPAETYAYHVTAVNQHGESRPCGEVAASCPSGAAPEDPCTPPGITVLTHGSGDFTLPVGMQTAFGPALDLLKLSITEPFGLGAGKVMFVLKVASLQNVPPSTTWPIQFQANGQEFIARMHTNAVGQVAFTLAAGTDPSPVTNPGVPADAASGFSADGTIRIVVSRTAIGGAAPGQQLTQFLIRVRSPEGGVTGLTPDNLPDSLARAGAYTLRGSENCGNPPDAVDDSATAKKNHPVLINVVANDTVHHPPLVVTQVSDPSNG
ncbi:MAG: fibronectin type III domain-containing protein, partial [Candidatus Acidiferrales bacterium]